MLRNAAQLRLVLCLALLGGIAVSLTPKAQAAPEPAPIPVRWEFDVTPGPLRATSVVIDGERKNFFYFTFKVENNTGNEQFLALSFTLSTDDGKILRSGRDVPREATQAILKRLRSPFLQDELQVQGRILQGEENAKEGLVIWPAENLDVNDLSIYVAGLSGETNTYESPLDGSVTVLRKTMMLRHQAPGTIDPSSDEPITRLTRRWIMR